MEDRCTQYAKDVVAGAIVAGPHVRAACRRHLKDLEQAGERGYVFDVNKASRVIKYFEKVLMLNGGDFEGVPFVPEPWQAFILGSLFGWVDAETGYRRFRMAYIETAKGSGKSPLVGGICLYGLTADGESRPEIYAAATKREQAMIMFRDAVAMVRQSPALMKKLTLSGGYGKEWNIANLSNDGFFRAISSGDGQSGTRVHMAALDEVHEHKDNTMVEMMRAGTKSHKQALVLMITNSGQSLQTVCGEYHDYGIKVSNGSLEDDSFFGYVCAMDEDDDPLEDESCWIKANPTLDAEIPIPGYKYIRDQVAAGKGIPSKLAYVKRLNFCQWVASDSPFISAELWAETEEDYPIEKLEGRRCYGGLDLGSTLDLTALALVFEPTRQDPKWRLLVWHWTPRDTMVDRRKTDRVPYDTWAERGEIFAPPGKALNRKYLVQHTVELIKKYDVIKIGFDRFRIDDMVTAIQNDDELSEAESAGIDDMLIKYGQGFVDLSPAIEEFERRLLEGEMTHNSNPVLRWCASNAVTVSDPAGNRKLDKTKGWGRIDGMLAAAMAIGTSIKHAHDGKGGNRVFISLI
jgi:phage terminase large subunit-like protein